MKYSGGHRIITQREHSCYLHGTRDSSITYCTHLPGILRNSTRLDVDFSYSIRVDVEFSNSTRLDINFSNSSRLQLTWIWLTRRLDLISCGFGWLDLLWCGTRQLVFWNSSSCIVELVYGFRQVVFIVYLRSRLRKLRGAADRLTKSPSQTGVIPSQTGLSPS